jgi:hypothetical protein
VKFEAGVMVSDKWKIAAVGAFDRFNYGDVLFAKVAEMNFAAAMPDAGITYYALRASDLTAEGGVPTSPLSDLYRIRLEPSQKLMVVLTGGELLAPTWTQMAEHHVPRQISRQMRRVNRRTGYSMWDPIWRRVYGCPNLMPWVIDPRDCAQPDQTHVVYNAVGGTSTALLSRAQLAWRSKALLQADWLTARDDVTAEALARWDVPKPEVAPDSAVTMAGLLAPAEAARIRKDILAHAGLDDGPYLCIQSGMKWAHGQEDLIAAKLREVHDRTGLNVLAFAIGRAAGHDDQFVSASLSKRLGKEPWFGEAPHDLTVNGVMALIAGSACYAGTSLHGFITAFAFGHPRVGLSRHLTKLIGFRDSWDLPSMPAGIEYADMPDAVDRALDHDGAVLTAKAAEVSKVYLDSFNRMIATLQAT